MLRFAQNTKLPLHTAGNPCLKTKEKTTQTNLFLQTLDLLAVSPLPGLQEFLCLDLSTAQSLRLHLRLSPVTGIHVHQPGTHQNTLQWGPLRACHC